MRLMEVDEAANHIKELVDPDANIIWGSAFNNDLDGKIRVSVVATGIDVEEATQAAPLQAKVFAFPGARTTTAEIARTAPPELETAVEPLVLTPPEPISETADAISHEPISFIDETTEAPDELTLDKPAETSEDELLLDNIDLNAAEHAPTETAGGARSWLTSDETPAEEPAARPQGGTLFERMSNIARGAAKAQVDEEIEGPRMRGAARDPLDIPRFLNRQNNQ